MKNAPRCLKGAGGALKLRLGERGCAPCTSHPPRDSPSGEVMFSHHLWRENLWENNGRCDPSEGLCSLCDCCQPLPRTPGAAATIGQRALLWTTRANRRANSFCCIFVGCLRPSWLESRVLRRQISALCLSSAFCSPCCCLQVDLGVSSKGAKPLPVLEKRAGAHILSSFPQKMKALYRSQYWEFQQM